jgi:hypothetical protein
MSKTGEGPRVTRESAARAERRRARLAARLRANLARRKAQARERAAGNETAPESLEEDGE